MLCRASHKVQFKNHGKLVLESPIDSATSLAEKSSACACTYVHIQISYVYHTFIHIVHAEDWLLCLLILIAKISIPGGDAAKTSKTDAQIPAYGL